MMLRATFEGEGLITAGGRCSKARCKGDGGVLSQPQRAEKAVDY